MSKELVISLEERPLGYIDPIVGQYFAHFLRSFPQSERNAAGSQNRLLPTVTCAWQEYYPEEPDRRHLSCTFFAQDVVPALTELQLMAEWTPEADPKVDVPHIYYVDWTLRNPQDREFESPSGKVPVQLLGGYLSVEQGRYANGVLVRPANGAYKQYRTDWQPSENTDPAEIPYYEAATVLGRDEFDGAPDEAVMWASLTATGLGFEGFKAYRSSVDPAHRGDPLGSTKPFNNL